MCCLQCMFYGVSTDFTFFFFFTIFGVSSVLQDPCLIQTFSKYIIGYMRYLWPPQLQIHPSSNQAYQKLLQDTFRKVLKRLGLNKCYNSYVFVKLAVHLNFLNDQLLKISKCFSHLHWGQGKVIVCITLSLFNCVFRHIRSLRNKQMLLVADCLLTMLIFKYFSCKCCKCSLGPNRDVTRCYCVH